MASAARFIIIGLGLMLIIHECHTQEINTCTRAAGCMQYDEGGCLNNVRTVCVRRLQSAACPASMGVAATVCDIVDTGNSNIFINVGDSVCRPNVPGGGQVAFAIYEGLGIGVPLPGLFNVAGYTNGQATCSDYSNACNVGVANDLTLTFTTRPCTTTTTSTTSTTPTTVTTPTTPTSATTTLTVTTTTQIPGCTCTPMVAVGQCPVTCGPGIQTFQTTCTGASCLPEGSRVHSGACPAPRPLCPVPGGWSQWSLVVGCTVTCGTGTGTRTRTCTNPSPVAGGTCVGASTDSTLCTLPPCVTTTPRRGGRGRRGRRGQRGRRGRPARRRGRRGDRRGGGRGRSRRPRRGRPNAGR